MCFLELTVRKIADYYLKLSSGWTPIFTTIFDVFYSVILNQNYKIVKFKNNLTKNGSHKNEIGQN